MPKTITLNVLQFEHLCWFASHSWRLKERGKHYLRENFPDFFPFPE